MTTAPSSSADEREALQRCQAGEPDAFRLIVERYGDLLYGTAYLMLHDRGEADDAVQEALLAGWRRIDTFDPGRPLAPWLVRILVNHVLQRRRKRRLSLVPLPDPPPAVAATDAQMGDVAVREWERHEVRVALAALPSETTQLLVLRFFAELSVPDIAATLGVPQGTIKSRLHRALLKLRDELERRHVFDEAK